MRTLALGMFAAIGIAVAVPAFADDVRVGVGPNGVRVGEHHDRDRDVRVRHVRREHVTVGYGHRNCKTVIIHEHGMTKKIKRCR